MSTVLAVIPHQQVTRPGLIIGISMQAIRLIVAVQPIVTTGEAWLVHMYRRLIALIRVGTSCHFAPVVTIVLEHLKWTKNLFLSQVIFKNKKEVNYRKTDSSVGGCRLY